MRSTKKIKTLFTVSSKSFNLWFLLGGEESQVPVEWKLTQLNGAIPIPCMIKQKINEIIYTITYNE